MFCKYCGSEIPEGCRFCENCGKPVAPKKTEGPKKPSDIPEPVKPKKEPGPEPDGGKKKIAFVIIAAIIVVAGCIGGYAIASSGGTGTEYNKKLQQAQQYVENGQYEEAEGAYLDLISREPKEEKAYLDLADLYTEQERYPEAIKILKTGRKNAVKKEAIEEKLKGTQRTYAGIWKTAYRKVLEDYQYEIEAYEALGEYTDPPRRIPSAALCDLNGDGVSELLFFAEDEANSRFGLKIYTYLDGKAQAIDYEWDCAIPEFMVEDGPGYQHLHAGGGMYHVVYKEKGQEGFSIYSIMPGEADCATLNTYEMDEDAEVTQVNALGWELNHWEGDTYVEESDLDKAEYYDMKTASTKEMFDEQYDQACENMEEALFVYDQMMYVDAIRTGDGRIWDKAEDIGPLAVTYDEMIELLTVSGAEKDEDEKTMTRLLEAYADGDTDTIFECNEKLPKTVPQMEVAEEERSAYEDLYYENIRDGKISEYGDYHVITDMDGDGRAEFLMGTGMSYAESIMEIWQYDGKKPVKLGEAPGSCLVSLYPGGNGLVLLGMHTGTEFIYIVTIEDGEVQWEQVGMREDSAEDFRDYLDLGCRIEYEGEADGEF